MKTFCWFALMACLALVCGSVLMAEDAEEKDPLADIKCPVSGKAVKADKTVEYREGKVYFCCGGCPEGFNADTAKYSTKANQQLIATGQYVVAKCPLSGAKLNAATKISIGGAEVAFCCNNCKGKVEKAEGDDKLAMVFSDKAFEKAYVKAEKKE